MITFQVLNSQAMHPFLGYACFERPPHLRHRSGFIQARFISFQAASDKHICHIFDVTNFPGFKILVEGRGIKNMPIISVIPVRIGISGALNPVIYKASLN